MPLEKKYIVQLRTILNRKGIDEAQKEDLVFEATGERTTSIRDMETWEAIALIRALNGRQDTFKDDSANQQRRQILALCHEMGWEDEDGKADMTRINAYCTSRGYLKKPLNDYKPSELNKLVTQFKTMHKIYLKNGNKRNATV